jgi:molecular chaperone HscB
MPNLPETAVAVPDQISCWSCSFTHPDTELFCPQCGKLQPPPGGNYFQVLGLDPKFQITLPAVEQQFHALSRKVHPDRFGRATENERQWSLADTALLNDAYRTLKDPISRTEYLLKLSGAEIGEEHAGKDRSNQKDPSRVPADLLEEVFELNMQLEEMRMARKMGETDPQLESDLQQAQVKFETLLGTVDDDLHTQWQSWDDGDAGARPSAQETMVALLDRRRYLRNLVRDVTETLGA